VDYELLAVATGHACATPGVLEAIGKIPSADKFPTGQTYLYEQAKFEAIQSIPNADGDGLIEIRAHSSPMTDGQICMTLVGRAYRVIALRAAPTCGASAAPQAPPSASATKAPKTDPDGYAPLQ
jgi:hypothetical protein